MPAILDRLLATVGPKAELTDWPEPAQGEDNLDTPMHEVPATEGGGWRGRRYRAIDLGSRIALGATALLIVRKLVKR